MRKILLVILLSFQGNFAQEVTLKNKESLESSSKNLFVYLNDKLNSSIFHKEKEIVIAFVVDYEGKVSNVKVAFCNNNEAKEQLINVLNNIDAFEANTGEDKELFTCYKIKLIFLNSEIKGLIKTILFKGELEDIQIEKSEFEELEMQLIDDENQVFSGYYYDEKPEYPGGVAEFHKMISKSFYILTDQFFRGGGMNASFIIELDGSISNIEVIRDVGYDSKKELIRILKKTKKWTPAKRKGKFIRYKYLFGFPVRP
jgi:hypothetical protein